MTRVLVTGGRDFADAARVHKALSELRSMHPGCCIVQGGARGADSLARAWCRRYGVPCITMDACWDYYDKRAGGIRNQWMLDYCTPNFVVAFPGGTGTADMVQRAKQAGVLVYEG